MTASEFERIKSKIKTLELRNENAKGRMTAIAEKWQREYGFSTLEKAKEKLAEMKADREAKEANRQALMKELEESFDWDSIT